MGVKSETWKPERKARVLVSLLQQVMQKYPKLRVGQILINSLDGGKNKDELYYITDEALIVKLTEYIKSLGALERIRR